MFRHEAKKLFHLLCKEKSCYILSLTHNHICQYFTSKERGVGIEKLFRENYVSEKNVFETSVMYKRHRKTYNVVYF